MKGFKSYLELEESYAKIAGTAFLGLLQNYLQDHGYNIPELGDLNVDAIMDKLQLTYGMILNYIISKNTLTDQEIEVLHQWCTATEYKKAREKQINICMACKKLCKNQKTKNSKLKNYDYCQEEKEIKMYAPDICKIKFQPDFNKEFTQLNKKPKFVLSPFWN